MIGVIVIFVMPSEIEDLALTLNNLKRSSIYINKDMIEYKISINMCLSDKITNWNNSKLPKEYIADRATELCKKYCDWCEYDLLLEYTDETIGCDSFRRKVLKDNPNVEFFIWLDCDMLCSDAVLDFMATAVKMIKSKNIEYYIVTPEILKHWDTSWDCLVNSSYLNWTFEQRLDINLYRECLLNRHPTTFTARVVNDFKFAGGWFTLISRELLELITIPDSFGHYGAADTFIMQSCRIIRNSGVLIAQYVINNLIMGEYYKYRTNKSVLKYISSINNKEEFRKESVKNFDIELENFKNRLKIKLNKN
jgi:hypothetical protein